MQTRGKAKCRVGPHTSMCPGEGCWGEYDPQTHLPLCMPPACQDLALPCATLLPVKGPGHCGLRCLRSLACPDNKKNRNFTSRLSHAAPHPSTALGLSEHLTWPLQLPVCCRGLSKFRYVTKTASGDPHIRTHFLQGFHHLGEARGVTRAELSARSVVGPWLMSLQQAVSAG